jgi:pimeloyl-ACP methyl ester carboxylesterase
VQVAVHELGGPDDPDAPVLLFSHATGFHGRVFAPLAGRLRHRFRCLAIDYRGHGLTELPDGVGLAWSGMGDDAVAVLDSGLRGPVHGIGHSMGGAALVMAAARRPGAIRSLWLYEPVLVPPGMLPPTGGENSMAAAAARRRSSFESTDEAFTNYASKPPLDQLHPDALRAYVDGGLADRPDGTVQLRCLPATEAAVFERAADSGAWELVAGLNIPVALVRGRSGEFGPGDFAPLAAAALPDATLVERPSLGHFGPLESPAAMALDIEAWVEEHH